MQGVDTAAPVYGFLTAVMMILCVAFLAWWIVVIGINVAKRIPSFNAYVRQARSTQRQSGAKGKLAVLRLLASPSTRFPPPPASPTGSSADSVKAARIARAASSYVSSSRSSSSLGNDSHAGPAAAVPVAAPTATSHATSGRSPSTSAHSTPIPGQKTPMLVDGASTGTGMPVANMIPTGQNSNGTHGANSQRLGFVRSPSPRETFGTINPLRAAAMRRNQEQDDAAILGATTPPTTSNTARTPMIGQMATPPRIGPSVSTSSSTSESVTVDPSRPATGSPAASTTGAVPPAPPPSPSDASVSSSGLGGPLASLSRTVSQATGLDSRLDRSHRVTKARLLTGAGGVVPGSLAQS